MQNFMSTFRELSSKSAFILGMGATLLVAFAIGFFVLLSMVLKNDAPSGLAANPTPREVGAEAAAEIVFSPITDEDWVRGNGEGKVTILEYSDLECPFCKTFHIELLKVIEQYEDDVRWVYRHFPLAIHSKAPKEAEAAECAGELAGNDGFWAYIDRIFEVSPTNNGLDLAELPNIAEFIGLDRAEFTSCLDSGKYADKVRQQTNDAVAAGGQGTPYSIIIAPDGEKIPVSGAIQFEQLQAFLEEVL